MLDHPVILALTVLLGIVASSFSLGLFLYFRTSHRPLGRAFALMLFGEFAGNLTLTTFATLEYLDLFGIFPVWGATMLRWGALSVAVTSSVHLARKVRDIIEGEE